VRKIVCRYLISTSPTTNLVSDHHYGYERRNRDSPPKIIMTYCISEASLRIALRHLVKYGDTDVFPHLPELLFFAAEEDSIASELSRLDLQQYNPAGAIECLAPKGRLSFRIAHQLLPIDQLLMLACTVEIGQQIETHRISKSLLQSFSYRFAADETGNIFASDHSYRHWLSAQREFIESEAAVSLVVLTDISDYYARINNHRLENLLDAAAPGHGAAAVFEKAD
jgi:hypothetical protein